MLEGISTVETMVVLLVILLVIGPEKLPDTLRTLGLWIGRLQRSFTNVKTEIEKEIDMDGIRRELHNEAVMEEMRRIQKEVDSTTQGLKDQADHEANTILAAQSTSEEAAADPSSLTNENELNTTSLNPQTIEPEVPPSPMPARTEAEVEAVYLRKQAKLKNDKTN
jgi:sec-independent protein translocase protein TatB